MGSVIILYGIPASGKTHYANKNYKSYSDHIVDCDRMTRNATFKSKIKEIAEIVSGNLRRGKYNVVVDGLITTNQQLTELVTEINKVCKEEKVKNYNLELVWWEENRERCLHNDIGRRSQNSVATISNITFEEPSPATKKLFFVTTRKIVEQKEQYRIWSAKNLGEDKEKLESHKWSTGGSYCDYVGNSYGSSGEEAPQVFEEFDYLMEELFPNITHVDYKKLYQYSVSIESSSDHDYYGGTTNYNKYVCDLKKLYEKIQEFDLETKYKGSKND